MRRRPKRSVRGQQRRAAAAEAPERLRHGRKRGGPRRAPPGTDHAAPPEGEGRGRACPGRAAGPPAPNGCLPPPRSCPPALSAWSRPPPPAGLLLPSHATAARRPPRGAARGSFHRRGEAKRGAPWRPHRVPLGLGAARSGPAVRVSPAGAAQRGAAGTAALGLVSAHRVGRRAEPDKKCGGRAECCFAEGFGSPVCAAHGRGRPEPGARTSPGLETLQQCRAVLRCTCSPEAQLQRHICPLTTRCKEPALNAATQVPLETTA